MAKPCQLKAGAKMPPGISFQRSIIETNVKLSKAKEGYDNYLHKLVSTDYCIIQMNELLIEKQNRTKLKDLKNLSASGANFFPEYSLWQNTSSMQRINSIIGSQP